MLDTYQRVRARVKLCLVSSDSRTGRSGGYAIAQVTEGGPEKLDFIVPFTIWTRNPDFSGPPVRDGHIVCDIAVNPNDPQKRWRAMWVHSQEARWYRGIVHRYDAHKGYGFVRMRTGPCNDALITRSCLSAYLPSANPFSVAGTVVDAALTERANPDAHGQYYCAAVRPVLGVRP